MKRLIICADGTWDKPDQTDMDAPPRPRRRIWPLKTGARLPVVPRPMPGATGEKATQLLQNAPRRKYKYRTSIWARTPSNVVKAARSILPQAADGTPQIVYYDEGVGTGWDWVDRWFGGGFGLGLSENILQCYRFLVENYSEGDEIFLLGFSRGAFTVRSLAGMIGRCGLLTKRDEYYIPEAYERYRDSIYPGTAEVREAARGRVPRWLPDWIRGPLVQAVFRRMEETNVRNRRKLALFLIGRDRRHRVARSRMIDIKFIGVWDTVGTLGIPIGGSLGRWLNRKYAFHDVRLGERVEQAYQALAIDEYRKPFRATLWDREGAGRQKVAQVWFTGYHANVGGGLRWDGLANIPFHWMVGNARRAGLEFDNQYVRYFARRIQESPRNSMTLFWRILGIWRRPIGQTSHGHESVHSTARKRFDSDPSSLDERRPYRPGNLSKFLERRKKSRDKFRK